MKRILIVITVLFFSYGAYSKEVLRPETRVQKLKSFSRSERKLLKKYFQMASPVISVEEKEKFFYQTLVFYSRLAQELLKRHQELSVGQRARLRLHYGVKYRLLSPQKIKEILSTKENS